MCIRDSLRAVGVEEGAVNVADYLAAPGHAQPGLGADRGDGSGLQVLGLGGGEESPLVRGWT